MLKKLLAFMLALAPIPAMGQQVYDAFGSTSLDSNFTTTSGSFATNNGGVYPTGGSLSAAAYSTGTFTNDQSGCLMYPSPTANLAGPSVRMSKTAATGYMTFMGSTGFELYLVVGGNGTTNVTTSTILPIATHEYCVTAVGTTISLIDNTAGTTVLSMTEATIASGAPGLSSYGSGDASVVGTGFRAINGGTPGPAPAPSSLQIAQSTNNLQTGLTDTITCTPTYSVAIYNGACAGTLVASNPSPVSISNLLAKGVAAGTTNLTYTQGSVSSNVLALTVFQHNRVTWYVRPDGGTRWDANRVSTNGPGGINYSTIFTAQCDGTHDAPFPASGTTNILGQVSNGVDQPCAFGDLRFMWDDQTYGGSSTWAMSGGDRLIVRANKDSSGNVIPWRVGFDTTGNQWCYGGTGTFGCVMPTIPAGTAAQHTQIFGENYALAPPLPSVSTHVSVAGTTIPRNMLTQVSGGHGVYQVFTMIGAQYTDLVGFNISGFQMCQEQGSPRLQPCNRSSSPVDDFASDGIDTSSTTQNVNIQDVWVHGTTSGGIKGALGPGYANYDDFVISFSPQTGLDFDKNGAISQQTVFTASNAIIEFSGCEQAIPAPYPYPTTDAQVAANILPGSCYSQSTGAVGDGIGTGSGQGMDIHVHNLITRFNTQDGQDWGHIDTGTHIYDLTNNKSYGNEGQTYKWGWGFGTINFVNNEGSADCYRMKYPLTGAPTGYNTNLQDFCRSGDNLSFNFQQGTQALIANNTIIGNENNLTDYKCALVSGQTSCDSTVVNIRNNIFRAYSDLQDQDYGGHNMPATYCGASCNESTANTSDGGVIGTINRDRNIYFGTRDCTSVINTLTPDTLHGTVTNEQCIDAGFVNQPTTDGTTFANGQLDNFNFALSSTSPAKGAGASVTGVTTDYNSFPFASPPSMGALEYGSVPTTPPAAAQTAYYFAAAGSDSNSCTQASPCQTVAKANTVLASAVAGTSVLFNGGDVFRDDYIKCLNPVTAAASTTLTSNPPACSGANGSPITISSYGTGQAEIDAADPITSTWTLVSGSTYSTTVSVKPGKVFVDGATTQTTPLLPVPNAVGAFSTTTTYNFLDQVTSGANTYVYGKLTSGTSSGVGDTITWAPISTSGTSQQFSASNSGLQNVQVTAGSFYLSGTTLYVHLADGSNPSSHSIEGTHRPYGALLESVNYVTVTGLTFAHAEKSGIASIAYSNSTAGGAYWTNEYNTFTGNNVFNVGDLVQDSIPTQDQPVQNVAGILVNASEGYTPHLLRGNLVSGNTIGRVDQYWGSNSGSAAGVLMVGIDGGGAANNAVATLNTIATVNAKALIYSTQGLYVSGGTTLLNNGGLVTLNTAIANDGNIFFSATAGGTASHNQVHNSFGEGIQAGGGSTSTSSIPQTISFNSIYHLGVSANGGSYNGIDCNSYGPADGLYITNNTIFDTYAASVTLERASATAGAGCTHAHVHNNIFDQNANPAFNQSVANQSNLIYEVAAVRTASSGAPDFGNNVYTVGANTNAMNSDSEGSKTCSAFLTFFNDTTSVCADAGFKSVTTNDYSLLNTSPAIALTAGAIPYTGTPAPTLTSVTAALSIASITVGGTSTIACTTTFSDGTHPTFTGSISATGAATLSGTTLTGVSAGSSVVTCTQGSQTASATLTVTAAASTVTTVTLTPASFTVASNTNQQLLCTPNTGTCSGYTWASSNPAVATVSSTGLVHSVAFGTANITATSPNGKVGTAAITVTMTVQVTVAPTKIGGNITVLGVKVQ